MNCLIKLTEENVLTVDITGGPIYKRETIERTTFDGGLFESKKRGLEVLNFCMQKPETIKAELFQVDENENIIKTIKTMGKQ